MSVHPRALLFLALLAPAFALSPTALADGCVELDYTNYADGIGLSVKPTSQTILFSFFTGSPGDGVETVIEITPALCPGGLGLGTGGDNRTLLPDPLAVIRTIPGVGPLIPLP